MVNMLAHSPHAVPEYPSVRDEVTVMEQVDIAWTTVLIQTIIAMVSLHLKANTQVLKLLSFSH